MTRRAVFKAGLCALLAAIAGSGRASAQDDGRDAPYVADRLAGRHMELEHRGGIAWYEAPPPPPLHGHWAQTRGRLDGEWIERCACGATRIDGGWVPERQPRTGGWI